MMYQPQLKVTMLIQHSAGRKIEDFLAYYRSTFPDTSITPKLHMLEDHILPFLEKWRVGFGLTLYSLLHYIAQPVYYGNAHAFPYMT